MKRFELAVAASVVIALFAFGCKSSKQEASAPLPAGHPAVQMDQAAAPAGNALSGKVVETMNSGGYTYVCIEKSGLKSWIAIPAATVKVGQEASFQPGMPMKNFKSKTLNRTFDTVIFSGGLIK